MKQMKISIVLQTIYAYIKTRLGGYVRPKRYTQIFDEIQKTKPKNIMEVGTWKGTHAKEMIAFAARYNNISTIKYFGFDLFETMTKDVYVHEVSKMPPREKDVREYIESSGAKITLYAGYTENTLRTQDHLPQMDFVFIDGGHSASTVLNDWNSVQKTMHKNTTVIFDDYWHNRTDGPKVVIDAIDKGKFNVEILPIVDVFFNPDFGRLVISLVKVTLK